MSSHNGRPRHGGRRPLKRSSGAPAKRGRGQPFKGKAGSPQRRRPPGTKGASPTTRADKALLSRDWERELQETARHGEFPRVKSLIAKALESFVEDDYASAVKAAEEAKPIAPRSGRIRELLGLALYRSERWHDASRELLAYRRLTGRKDQNHVIADCYRALGRFDRAVEICREVAPTDVDPEVWTEVVIVAASSLADSGDLDRALAQIARADLAPKQIASHTLRAWYVRAELLEKKGDHAQARRAWERIYEEDPDFYDVAVRLGRD